MTSPRASSHERPRNWLVALRDFARARLAEVERCELCGQPISAAHAHLLEPIGRRLVCACQSCAARCDDDGSATHRRIPEAIQRLDAFRLSDAAWDAFRIPIGLAFFFRTEADDRVTAMYPGPTGAVESLLDLQAWRALVAVNPVLGVLRRDVEALLVCRVGKSHRIYVAPIDRCYALAGILRTRWHGLSGGADAWEAIERFFAELDASANQPQPLLHHA